MRWGPCRFCAMPGWFGRLGSALGACACLSACGTVIAAADTVGTVAVGAVGLAADAAVGTAKIAGKVVGKATDAVLDGPAPASP